MALGGKKRRDKFSGAHIREWGYGCAGELDPDDKRLETYAKQRAKRGFDDTELWNLDVTFARFIAPRLRRFAKIDVGVPGGMDEAEWEAAMDKMASAFEMVEAGDFPNEEAVRLQQEGFALFAQYFRALWW